MTCLKKVGGALKPRDLARLKGIGITNQRETTILWDSTTGKCLHNAIVWCDSRTADLVKKMTGSKSKDRLRVTHTHTHTHLLPFLDPLPPW